MGLDCWVYASDEPVEEQEVIRTMEDGTEYGHLEQSLDESIEVWYGRKTHIIMDYLLREADFSDDNCTYISLDHLDVEDLKRDYTKDLISPSYFNEYELECFKDLIDALSEVSEDKYIYFFAWY